MRIDDGRSSRSRNENETTGGDSSGGHSPESVGGTRPLLEGPILAGVTIDGRSDPALSTAVDLAEALGRPLEVLHVIEAQGPLSPSQDTLVDSVREGLVRKLSGRVPEDTLRSLRVDSGSPDHVLLECSHERRSGLIVLGAHRRRGLLDLGRTARSVLTRARCPVWVHAGEAVALRELRRVLAPLDLSESSRVAACFARDLADAAGAELTFMHSMESPAFAQPVGLGGPAIDPSGAIEQMRQRSREAFEQFAAGIDPRARTLFVDGFPAGTLVDEHVNHDLVVMATRGRGAVAATLLGSVTNALLKSASRPVVAIAEPVLAERPPLVD